MDIQTFIQSILEFTAHATQAATEAVSASPEAAQEAAHAAEETGIAGMFGISWKLFLAQLINFGIVLLVLWKWVFGPVSKAMQARADRINKSLADAGTIEYEKGQLEQTKKEVIAEARKEAAGIVASAQNEAEKVKTEILQSAKDEQAKVLDHTKKQLAMETEKAVQNAKGEIANLVVTATETILQEKIDAKKDQGLIAKALEKLSA